MPDYFYKARDDAGRLVSGTMSADSTDELTLRLRKMGYMAVSVAPAAAKANSLRDISDSIIPVRLKDLAAFSFKLSNMLNSGLSILTSLRAIESQTGNRRLKAVTGDLCRQVESGSLLSEGLSKHPRVFDRFLVNMVKAGEESGKLNEVLRRYSLFLDDKQDLQEKIKGALFYPAPAFVVRADCNPVYGYLCYSAVRRPLSSFKDYPAGDNSSLVCPGDRA